MNRPNLARALAGSLLLIAASCGDAPDPDRPGVVVTDSLGVALRTWGHTDQDLEAWSADPDPILRVGSLEGDTPDVFGRISSLILVPGGGVVVTDALAGEIRRFSSTGEHRGSMGRLGEGPGEFSTSVTLLRVAGDSMWVWDQRQRRLSIFADGDLASSWTVPTDVSITRPMPVGSGLIGEAGLRVDGELASGLSRPPLRVVRVDRDGSVTELFETEGREGFMDIRTSNGEITGVNIFRLPFGRQPYFAVVPNGHGTRIIGGPNDRLVLREWSGDGELRAIHRYPGMDRPMTEARVQRARDDILTRFDEPSPAQRQQLDLLESTLPDYVPAFDRLWADDEDRLWLRRSVEDGVEEWMVLGLDDLRPLARIGLPRGFALMDVRDGLLGGRWLDELEVSHAQVLRLRTGG